ncbi:MAG: hypothetical protein ABEJ02_02675 [Candidatus Paceibacteria bacterium]
MLQPKADKFGELKVSWFMAGIIILIGSFWIMILLAKIFGEYICRRLKAVQFTFKSPVITPVLIHENQFKNPNFLEEQDEP